MASLTLAFAGTPEFAVPALQALIDAGHRVAGVWTQPDRAAGRGRHLRASPVKERALALGLPVHQPATLRHPADFASLAALEVDAMVVVAYGLILPPAVLALPRLGCFNIHASLLPRWRGAAPIQRAILAGDVHTGVTIMRMEAGLDTGPILLIEKLALQADDTTQSLQEKLAVRGARGIVTALGSISGASAAPQPIDGVTYAAKIQKSEARIDWVQSAVAIERQVRAFNPWPVAQTTFEGVQLRIWQAEIAATSSAGAPAGCVFAVHEAGFEVACGSGSLVVSRVQVAGRSAVTGVEFSRGRKLIGQRLGAA